jgi:phosphatidylglycerol:prolipoprotein diacylglycerol transferase
VPFPHFDPVLIHLGPIAIRWYGMAYLAGIFLGWRYGVRLIRNTRIWPQGQPLITAAQLDDLVLWVAVGVIVGGRLGSVLFYGQGEFLKHPIEIFEVWNGGMSFHGGFLGVALAIFVFARVNRIEVLRLADLVAPCVPIGLFFGRIANFINGELWGRPTTLPWGIIFPHAPDVRPRHPSQLYEACLEGLVLFLLLRLATHRLRWFRLNGSVTGLFVFGYGLFRIALENVRQPDAGFDHLPLGLTMGILLSTPMLLGGAWLLWWSRRHPPEIPAAAQGGPAE